MSTSKPASPCWIPGLLVLALGCGPKDSASTAPSSDAPAAGQPAESQASAPSSSLLSVCRVEFEQDKQRVLGCGERTIMDVRFPEGFPHDEALMVALGQTISAIHEIQGLTTMPKRLAPVQTLGRAQLSSFVLEVDGEAGKVAPVIVMTMSVEGESRTMWCMPSVPFGSEPIADRQWCEEALSAFASGANLVGASMMSARDAQVPCPEDEPCAEGPSFADSLAGMQAIADKVCACGDDADCLDEVREMMRAWSAGPGTSRDPGTREQNMQMGEALERLMMCNTPFGLELLSQ